LLNHNKCTQYFVALLQLSRIHWCYLVCCHILFYFFENLCTNYHLRRKTLCHNPSLGFATKAKGETRGRNKWGTRETHLILSGVQENVREWTLTLSRQLPLGELEYRRTLESSGNNYRGQNPLVWKVFYIIRKLLKPRCLKWARITHLDIWNTSYGQKNGRESNWQFDSWPLKVDNRSNFRACRWHATYRWKALNEDYNFVLDHISIRVCAQSYGAPKSRESQFWQF